MRQRKQRKAQRKEERRRAHGTQRRRERRQGRRHRRRLTRGGGLLAKGVWCHVRSEPTNTKVVRMWQEKGKEGVLVAPTKRVNVMKTAGSRGYQGSRHRRTDYAAKALRQGRRKKGKALGMPLEQGRHVFREGKGKGRKALRTVMAPRPVRTLTNRTREPHNGCEGKKARRK